MILKCNDLFLNKKNKIYREELSTKYITYSDGAICTFGGKSSIVACGYQSTSKYIISQIDISQDRQESSTVYNKIFYNNFILSLHNYLNLLYLCVKSDQRNMI